MALPELPKLTDMPGPGDDPVASSPGSGSELELHAKALSRAIKPDDARGIANAFRALKKACDEENDDAGTDDYYSGD